jgi:hypothetical protein
MAQAGNHGRIIPRDKELLTRLYWTENRSLVEVAALFDVTHKSLSRVFIILGIPRRKRRAKGQSRWFKCIECEAPTRKIRHAGNGSLYGTRCRECRRLHYNRLAREYAKNPEVRAKQKALLRRWYLNGALNPNGELQWLNKGKALLRNARRLCLNPQSPAACDSRKRVFELERTLRG